MLHLTPKHLKRPSVNIFVLLIVLLLGPLGPRLNAQGKTVDSLKAKISLETSDTAKATLLLKLGNKYGLADSGIYYSSLALNYARRSGNKNKIALCLSVMGYHYLDLQKKSEALTCFKDALGLFEETKNLKGLSSVCLNIGNLFNRMEKYDLAKEYFEKGLEIDIQAKDTVSTAEKYSNLANVCLSKRDYQTAIGYYQSALVVFKKFKQERSVVIIYGNIGATYEFLNQADRAVYYYNLSLREAEKNNLTEEQISALYNLGNIAYVKKDFPVCIDYFKKGLSLCKKPESLSHQIALADLLWGSYYNIHNIDSAFNYLFLHAQLKDSLSKIMNSKQLNQLSVMFETEKKEKQIEIQNLSIATQQAELNKRQVVLYSVISGLVLVLFLGYNIYRTLQKNKRQTKIISEQKKQVDKAFARLHEKNKEVMDSIHYARRIQNSLLPSEMQIAKHLSRLVKTKDTYRQKR